MSTFKFENKYACAAYFNIARDNFHRTMMEVLKKIGINKSYTETDLDVKLAEMLSVLNGDMAAMENQEDAQKLIHLQSRLRQLLFRSFPILGPVSTEIVKKRHRERFNDAWKDLTKEEQKAINSIEDDKEKRKKKNALVDDDGEREATCLDCFEAIYVIGCCLTDCRNYFTHYKPYNTPEKLQEIYDRQKQVASWLSNVFTASRRLDKKRNKLSSVEMEFITNHAYKIKTDEDGKNVTDDEGKDVFIQNHDFYFSIFGESFIAKIDEDGYASKDYDAGETPFGNADNFALSDFGLLYLCCCFITRSQAHDFIKAVDLFANSPENITDGDYSIVLGWSQIPGLDDKRKGQLNSLVRKLKIEKLDLTNEEDRAKIEALKNDTALNRQDTPENDIIREMLSIYRVRIPRGNRFDKQDNATTVALDMLNELCRCPRPVYDVLTSKGQKAFEDVVDKETGGIPSKVDRIRYTDRFPYLALRAIDEANLLPNIRFQIRLGYYRFDFYDKQCIDGKTLLRRLGKAVNGFGKLSAIDAKRKLDWSPAEDGESQEPNKFQRKVYAKTQLEDGKTELDLLRSVEDVVGNEPYITDSAAYYNIHNNRIGLYWEKNDESNQLNNEAVLVFPTLSAKDNGGNSHRKAVVKDQKAPLCSLSVRDLPALLFLCYLYGHSGSIAENVIIKKYEGLKNFFTDLSRKPSGKSKEVTLEIIQNEISKKGLEAVLEKRYNLSPADIPQRIKDYLDVEISTSHDDTIDVIGYFRERLLGTEYELSVDATIDTIKELINELGLQTFNKRYAGIPARKRPVLSQKAIVQNGIDRILEFQKRYEEVPETIITTFIDDIDVDGKKEEEDSKSDERPSFFRDILLGNSKDDKNPNIGRLERRIKQIDSQLKKLKNSKQVQFDKSNRYGTKSYKDVRYGRLAEILAESMVKWQSTKNDGKDKITGLNYRRLVDFLASYNPFSSIGEYTGINALIHLLSHRGAGFLGSSNSHPFLPKVLAKSPKNIEELFQIYMEQEKNELLSIKGKLQSLNNDTTIEEVQALAPAFVHPYREKWTVDTRRKEQIRKMAANYITPGTTLLLPDGLFTDAIIQRLKNGYQAILDEVKENDKDGNLSRNVSFFISKYLEMQDDQCQSFYEANTEPFYRDYDLLSKLGEKPLSRVQIAEMIQGQSAKRKLIQRISYKFKADEKEGMIRKISDIKKNEKAILRFKTQDIVLFLTAKKMLQNLQTAQDGLTNTDENIHRTNLGRQTTRAIDRNMSIQQDRMDKVNRMRLHDVFDGDALNITMDYAYKKIMQWRLLDEHGNPVKKTINRMKKRKEIVDEIDVTVRREIYITQDNVTFKNFGRIYRVLNDPRLDLLLLLLIEKREGGFTHETGPEYTVSAAQLANEFATFESLRPQAFEFIHHLEKTAYPLLSNPESNETYQFKNMMRLLCGEQEADAVNQLRISFAHSIYKINADLFGQETTLQVPLVSEQMEEQMINRAKEIIQEK